MQGKLYLISLVFLFIAFWQTAVGTKKTYEAGDGTAGMFNHLWAFLSAATFCFLAFVQTLIILSEYL